jgi:hypothetical protein
VRRYLGPFLPVLRPIRRGAQRLLVRSGLPAAWIAVRRAGYEARDRWNADRGRPVPPIRPLRKYEYDALVARAPYYRGRWRYMSVAGRQEADLIERGALRTALELGPHLRPLTVGADAMVLSAREGLECEGAVIVHDATKVPWPMVDGRYDLFVALQVFEHLGDAQALVFREVRRVARNAIISLPIDWVMDDPRNCHHGITNQRVLSWFAPIVPTRVVVGNGGPRKRLVYVFEGLVPPAD